MIKKILVSFLMLTMALPLFAFGQQTGPTFPGTVSPNVPSPVPTITPILPGQAPGVTPGIPTSPSSPNFSVGCSNVSVQTILICVINIFQRLIPLTASIAVLFFLWGVFKIIRAQGDTSKIEEGRRTAIWGIVALFLIIAIGGVVVFLQKDLISGVSNTIP